VVSQPIVLDALSVRIGRPGDSVVARSKDTGAPDRHP
jgi:hypothetical protein